jgi:hypothetical protein
MTLQEMYRNDEQEWVILDELHILIQCRSRLPVVEAITAGASVRVAVGNAVAALSIRGVTVSVD